MNTKHLVIFLVIFPYFFKFIWTCIFLYFKRIWYISCIRTDSKPDLKIPGPATPCSGSAHRLKSGPARLDTPNQKCSRTPIHLLDTLNCKNIATCKSNSSGESNYFHNIKHKYQHTKAPSIDRSLRPLQFHKRPHISEFRKIACI